MIVSGGLGNTTLPFRIGRPPEIVVIDLAPAPAA
jgi:predicted MPP superfamily phosphohydrolase